MSEFKVSWNRSAIAVALLLALAGCREPAKIPLGVPAPPIQAEGWLNGKLPSEAELKGEVVVVDAFGYWCPPCRAEAPELVETHRRYSPQGVVFVGLTPDGSNSLSEISTFVEETGMTWPIGYGAQQSLVAFNVEYFPTLIVIGADGRIAWTNEERGSLGVALDRALRAAKK